jgi:quercetin dioxygenase-like cupin family protein
MDKKKIKEDWHKRGYSFDIWTDPPGQEWLDFVHSADELVMLIEGDLEVIIGGKKHIPKPGEELFIPRNTSHSVKNIGKTISRWYYGYKH